MSDTTIHPVFPEREKEVLQTMTRPELYAPGPAPFWDDDYISSQMLKAHLDPDFEGASRKHDFIRRSADWIAGLIPDPAGKSLLDLGCGPGLYTTRFHQKGFAVTGIDYSRRSIAYAKAHSSPEIDYRCFDYLAAAFPDGMAVVTLIYCDFGVLSTTSRRLLLRKIHAALKPGGYFVFDVFTPHAYAGYRDGESIERNPAGGFWSPEPCVVITRKQSYPEDATFLRQIAVLIASQTRFYHLWEHVFSREELRSDLRAAGFTGIDFSGDLAGAPDTPESPTLGVVAKA